MKKQFILLFAVLLAVGGLFAGCSKKTGASSHVFDNATPQLKEVWTKAVTADAANDYVTACTAYRNLLAEKVNLSGDQLDAVNAASIAINQRMNAAVNAGDAAAKKATADLYKLQK